MKILYRILSWIVTLFIPLALLFLSFRLLLTPAFLQIEYRMPGFPVDSYGFTQEDRLYWSRFVWDYPVNDAGIEYLGDLAFKDGSPLFNDRELSHMVDVKNVVIPVMWIGYGSWIMLAGLGLWAHFGKWIKYYQLGLKQGGWLMVILAAGVAAFVVIAFSQFFTVFHSIFFTGDSWLFLYSDTLIRLFPLRFWQDCFLYGGGVALIGGLLLGLLVKPRK
jgi:integral membrane protein (TIGR01906 family)